MGVQVRIVAYAREQETAADACRAAFERIAELDDALSDYRVDSELNHLCARAGGGAVSVSDDLFRVLWRSQLAARHTGGAFDVTAGPYVRLWRKTRDTGKLPSEQELREAGERVGWRKMLLDPDAKTVQLLVPGMQLDLGGIAKGYALDHALAVLKRYGVRRALIEAGGEIVVGKAPPGERAWRIEIADAQPGRRFVGLVNAAISSSGDVEQYVEIGGVRYSHVVDPRTGLGVTTRVAATVIAPDAFTSDPLATAACVMDRKKALRLIRSIPGARAYIRRASDAADQAPPSAHGLVSPRQSAYSGHSPGANGSVTRLRDRADSQIAHAISIVRLPAWPLH